METSKLLQNVIHSDYVGKIVQELACNADAGRPFRRLTDEEVSMARQEFDSEYRNVEIATHIAAQAACDTLLGGQPKITLVRDGLAGYNGSDLEQKVLETDFTGRWDDMNKVSDEELAYSEDETIVHLEGKHFYPKKSRIIFEPDGGVSDTGCESVALRLKAKYNCVDKITDHIFDLDGKYDKIRNTNGITDFGGLRIIAKDEASCFDIYNRLAAPGSGVKVVEDSLKNYIQSPKGNGYQALHFLADVDGYYVEMQVKSREMDDHAEHNPAAHHEAGYGNMKDLKRQYCNAETDGRLYKTKQQLGRFIKRMEGSITV